MENENIYVAPGEAIGRDTDLDPAAVSTSDSPVTPEDEPTPLSLDDVIAGLRGFGIEENEEILTFISKNGRKVRLRITNMPTDEEIKSLIAAEAFKGYAWVQRIRVELLSRSISWIDGIDLRGLKGVARLVTDAEGVKRDIQVVLRDTILGWGQELVTTLWKIAMVHSDRIEKRYQAEFPDSTIMTETERRFMETLLKEIEDSNKAVIIDTLQEAVDEEAKIAEDKDN